MTAPTPTAVPRPRQEGARPGPLQGDARPGVLDRNAVRVSGRPDGRPVVLVHGFGCDAGVWQRVVPALEPHVRVVVLDQVGAGSSDLSAYDPVRYDGLEGYARDLVEVCEALDLQDAVLVGHSVSAMTAVLAQPRSSGRVTGLVLVGPSPRYVDDPRTGYRGGFSREEVEGLLTTLESDWVGWSAAMAPVIAGSDHPVAGRELEETFCRFDPEVAAQFAEVVFLSDTRADLDRVTVPSLVLQCRDDALAAVEVGEYVAGRLPDARLLVLETTGHCPHMTAPGLVAEAVLDFVAPP